MISEIFLKKIDLELSKRKDLNQQYSLRAFARDLDISVSILSRVRTRSLPLSENLKQKLKSKLFKTDLEFNTFALDCLNSPDLFFRTSKFNTSDFVNFRLWYFWTMWQTQKGDDPSIFLDNIIKQLSISKTDALIFVNWFSQVQRNTTSHDSTCFSFANVFKNISQQAFEERYLNLLQTLPQTPLKDVAPFISQKAYPLALSKNLAERIQDKITILTNDIVQMIERDDSPKDQVCELIVSLLPSIDSHPATSANKDSSLK